MKFRDIVDQIYIDPRKMVEYALNQNHPRGRHKARVFKSALGFDNKNFNHLKAQIESQILDAEANEGEVDQHGKRYTVDLLIKGSSENEALVRTCWLVPPGTRVGRLITLLVRKSHE